MQSCAASQQHPPGHTLRGALTQKAPAGDSTIPDPVCDFAFDLHKGVTNTELSPRRPPFLLLLFFSVSLTRTARLFLLEMPGGLGSAIWSPPSAEETFAGSECSFPPGTPQGPRPGSRAAGRPPGGVAVCWAAPFLSAVTGQQAGVHEWGGGFPSPRYILYLLSSVPDLAAFSPPTTSCCHLECWETGELEGRLGWGLQGGGPELEPSEGRRKRRCWHPGQGVGPVPPLLTLSGTVQNSSHQLLPI